ncbi:MAG: PQQ-binding-like beta-propeller repeat protein [Acidobacteriota bacterium]
MRTPQRVSVVLALLCLHWPGASFAGNPAPAVRAAAVAKDPIEGTKWLGTLTAPNGSAVLGLEFRRNAKGDLYALAYLPVMHMFTQPTARVTAKGSDYVLEDIATHAHLAGDKLSGEALYAHFPFELHRVEAFPPPPDQSPPANLPTGPAPRWSHDLGAPAWASPVVRDGGLYLGTADGHFHAISATDGHELWNWMDGTPIYGDALVTANAIYFINERTELVRLDRRTGCLRWRVAIDAGRAAATMTPADDTYSHRTATPVLADGTLYLGSTDGATLALDPETGATRWRSATGAAKISSAVAVSDDRLLVGAMDGTLLALRRTDGKVLWRQKLPAPIASAPVIDGALAFVGGRDYQLHAFKLADGSEVWRQHFWVSWVESVPRVVDDTLYIGSSDLRVARALAAKTGAVQWSTDVYGSPWGSPVVTASSVYLGVVGATNYPIDHRPSIVALDRANGAIRWRRPAAAPSDSAMSGYPGSLALDGDTLYAAGLDGMLLAIPAR